MASLEVREDELNALLLAQPSAQPTLIPNMAELYRAKIAALHEAFSDPTVKDEAFGIIRSLVDEVQLIPEDGKLRVELRGALAGILALASGGQKAGSSVSSVSALVEQVKMVAGVGFEPTTFRL